MEINPESKILGGGAQPYNLAGRPGMVTMLSNLSSITAKQERNIVLATMSSQGLLYLLVTSPESQPIAVCDKILQSLKLDAEIFPMQVEPEEAIDENLSSQQSISA